MLNRIKKMFAGQDAGTPGRQGVDQLQLAAAALLVEAARMDDTVGEDERATITELVRKRFDLSDDEVGALVDAADREADHSVELSRFARRLRDGFDHGERVEMIEMLWRVVYADGIADDHEASLLRRVAGLLYVSDQECGEARKRVLATGGTGAATAP